MEADPSRCNKISAPGVVHSDKTSRFIRRDQHWNGVSQRRLDDQVYFSSASNSLSGATLLTSSGWNFTHAAS